MGGKGGKMHTYNNNHTRRERDGGWRGEIYVRGEREEKEDHVFFL